MNDTLCCVFDTNMLVSAVAFKRSVPARALREARARGILLRSNDTAQELSRVLRYPKFDQYVPLHEREEFLSTFIADSRNAVIPEMIRACRDPEDDKFLELAVAGHASHIVTGDRDLLVLHPFRGISIVTPSQFLAAITRA